MTLADCSVSQRVQIKDLAGDPVLVARLREMGFIRGEEIELRGKAPFGEPLLVEIRGAVIALRLKEASCVRI